LKGILPGDRFEFDWDVSVTKPIELPRMRAKIRVQQAVRFRLPEAMRGTGFEMWLRC
jgi:hypothetical protein